MAVLKDVTIQKKVPTRLTNVGTFYASEGNGKFLWGGNDESDFFNDDGSHRMGYPMAQNDIFTDLLENEIIVYMTGGGVICYTEDSTVA